MRKLRSLVVDDDDDIRMILTFNLLTGPVEVVGEARDGQEAIEMALELKPDVVVMDLMMPRMDGAEATMVIKKELPDVAVFGFTAVEAGAERMLRAGATAVFSKTTVNDLLVTLQLLLPEA